MIFFLISACTSQKTVSSAGNDFPIIEVEPRLIPISIYGCESIIAEGDTVEINNLLCSDSTQFTLLFQELEDFEGCMEQRVEGTTFYSVIIGQQGEFERLRIIKEVSNCFNNVYTDIESILNNERVLEQKYFNTELIFYHKFRIKKIEN